MIGEPSDRALQAVSDGAVWVTQADILNPGQPPVTVGVVDGTVTADRTQPTRYKVDVTLDPEIDLGLLDPFRSRLRVRKGIDFGTPYEPDVEWFPAGTYRVQNVSSSLPAGKVQVTGVGLESYVSDDEFLTTGQFEAGSASATLYQIISESVPGGIYLDVLTPDQWVGAATYSGVRWGAESAPCQMLATAMGGEVYGDATGRFVVARVPTIKDTPVGRIVGGPGGTLGTVTRTASRDGVPNLVVASSSATSSSTTTALYALAWDGDPYSPTYLGPDATGTPVGTFGRVKKAYDSPLLITYDQCWLAAHTVLAKEASLVTQVSLTCLTDATIEPGDVRLVQTQYGLEQMIVDGLSLPLSPGTSSMTLTCRSNRVAPVDVARPYLQAG